MRSNRTTMRRDRLVHGIVLALVALATAPALAQQGDDAPAAADQQAVTLDKVTVAATRYSAADMQMAASNTANVLSAEDLKYTAVHNIAEALGLMPGVNVINTGQSYFGGIDGAARGEGMFASVRGLNAEYNVNLVNGVNVAQGMPYSRSVQLRLLPPSGLQTIVLNKTSTAAMDGDAIGGTIDYRTPTAFDFGAHSGGSVSLSGRMESRARDYGDSGLGGGVAGEWHGRFGSDNQFGLYVSGYYDTRDYVNSQYAGATAAGSDGTWEFARTDAEGNLAAGYDPQQSLLGTGMYAGYSEGRTRRFGGNVSFDWRVDPTLLVYARGTFSRAFTEQNTGYSQLIPQNVSYEPTGVDGVYQPKIGAYAARYWYETNPEMADLATIQFGADKELGNWTISPNVFYGFGNNDRPDHIEISARTDQYSDRGGKFAYGAGQLLGQDSDGYPVPLLTPEMAAAIDDIGGMYVRRAGQLTRQYSGQKKGGLKLDLRRVFDDGALQELQFGIKHVVSSRRFTGRNWTTGYYGGYALLQDIGLIDGHYDAAFPGKYDWDTVHLSNDALKALINERLTESSFDTCGSEYVNNWNCNTMRGTEAVSAAYAMATLRYGDLEIIPGLRYEYTRIRNTYWATDDQPIGHFENNHSRYRVPLPSVFLNWRPGDGDSVYRAGLWTSYTRPAFVQLGGGSSTSISADTGRITITEGNPDLDPIKSLNLDLSGEWRNDRGGHAMLAAYYKHLSDYIYESGSNAVNQGESGEGETIYRRPQNGGDGEVYGLELALRQKFQDLPEPLDGLGIGINATRQKTRVDLGMDGFRRERIQNAPDLLANAELFYEKGPLSVNLSWHHSGEYVAVYDYLRQGASWDNLWVKPSSRIDLHVGYALGESWRADLSIANLTKRESYRAHVGHNSTALQDIVDSGMTSLLTVRYAF
ncbi:TonB-dependent receptor [Stenotrophomonas sp. MMGLT7]|uniref:TonB-dependent receptor n=1 Tax=Stenotrophomonas sp. MMGLT7 TaxID=2901227 RepID=UPI001E654759|nr:TonB-dependent receptor [Stenotrophomonas sp. MMGLT7]MCD7098246.1 TonB-dependent receptor [Stenotrophomonas sp. MMGLT7]